MELSISDDKTKELLTEVMIELLRTKRDLIRDILMEALEEVGLANAIAEGRTNEFVSEEEVFTLLERAAE
ncbi:hypothetical protein VU08_06895 [Desulfobulbus sp. F5]|nr:hypothetical protein [Desulfobulbus sp. F5]